MQTSDVPPSDIVSGNGVKPAMAVGQSSAIQSPPVPVGSLPGALPRGPQPAAPDYRKLASKVDVRLTAPLRAALTAAAKREGVTDGALIRRLVADALGVEAEVDRASAPRVRIPPAELEALSNCVREIGIATQQATLGQTDEVIKSLGRIRGVLIPTCVGLAGRCA
ncbi:hypothetical protein C0214_20270 [Methylobacterium sp. DM1]|nr:hypothetical protein C0214_20270 [Methylobacterium sp. DM1]